MSILAHDQIVNDYDGVAGDDTIDFDVEPRARLVQVFVDAATPTGTAPTLDIFVQGSWDGGTTWRDIAHATQLVAAGGVSVLVPVGSDIDPNVDSTVGAARSLGANTTNQVQAPPKLRLDLDFGGTVDVWVIDAWVTQYG